MKRNKFTYLFFQRNDLFLKKYKIIINAILKTENKRAQNILEGELRALEYQIRNNDRSMIDVFCKLYNFETKKINKKSS